jgi:hypothetical protein
MAEQGTASRRNWLTKGIVCPSFPKTYEDATSFQIPTPNNIQYFIFVLMSSCVYIVWNASQKVYLSCRKQAVFCALGDTTCLSKGSYDHQKSREQLTKGNISSLHRWLSLLVTLQLRTTPKILQATSFLRDLHNWRMGLGNQGVRSNIAGRDRVKVNVFTVSLGSCFDWDTKTVQHERSIAQWFYIGWTFQVSSLSKQKWLRTKVNSNS